MNEDWLAVIEERHRPDPWMEEHRHTLWCMSADCHQVEGDEAVHVEWPCDAALAMMEVRRLQAALRLSEAARGALVGQD